VRTLPIFDLHYVDGLALVDIAEHFDLDSVLQSDRHHRLAEKVRMAMIDVERLKQGWRPSPALLVEEPLLADWDFAGSFGAGSTVLAGVVTGHPKLGSGGFCTTSLLVAIDTHQWSWARTLSRFYRLENPAQKLPGLGSSQL
jgi:hypothetical protein